MKLKTVTIEGKTYAEVEDGKPIYTYEDGKDVAYDAPKAVDKIGELNNEAKGHREAKEAAEAKLKVYEGIEDPEAARAALETVQNLSAGELKTNAQVEEIKNAAKKSAEDQVSDIKKTLEARIEELSTDNVKLRSGWDSDKLAVQFNNSKYVAEKLTQPGAVMHRIFSDRFKIEDGKVIGLKPNGDKIYARANPGELADFDEALSTMVDGYAYRESLVRGSGGGSGGGAGNGSGHHGAKTLTRAEFEAKDSGERSRLMGEGYSLVD